MNHFDEKDFDAGAVVDPVVYRFKSLDGEKATY